MRAVLTNQRLIPGHLYKLINCMSEKSELAIHSVLIIADIFIILFFIARPQADRVNGGLGMALMAMYGLVLIILLVIYEGIFLRCTIEKDLTV